MPSKLFITGSKCLPEVCLFKFKIIFSFKEISFHSLSLGQFSKKKNSLITLFLSLFEYIINLSYPTFDNISFPHEKVLIVPSYDANKQIQ